MEERQQKAKAKNEKPLEPDEVDLGVFDRGVEARMGTNLRDRVEAVIKKVRSLPGQIYRLKVRV